MKEPIQIMLDSEIRFCVARDGFARAYIKAALERNRWNQGATAESLMMHRNTLSRYMKRFNLSNPEVLRKQPTSADIALREKYRRKTA